MIYPFDMDEEYFNLPYAPTFQGRDCSEPINLDKRDGWVEWAVRGDIEAGWQKEQSAECLLLGGSGGDDSGQA